MKRMQGMIAGMMLGAAAVTAYGMMSARTQRRIGRCAAHAGKKMARFANDLLGR